MPASVAAWVRSAPGRVVLEQMMQPHSVSNFRLRFPFNSEKSVGLSFFKSVKSECNVRPIRGFFR